jgi:hypothetical protein
MGSNLPPKVQYISTHPRECSSKVSSSKNSRDHLLVHVRWSKWEWEATGIKLAVPALFPQLGICCDPAFPCLRAIFCCQKHLGRPHHNTIWHAASIVSSLSVASPWSTRSDGAYFVSLLRAFHERTVRPLTGKPRLDGQLRQGSHGNIFGPPGRNALIEYQPRFRLCDLPFPAHFCWLHA